MRKASEVEYFPYKNSTNCYIEVGSDNSVSNLSHKNKSDRPDIEAAYNRALSGNSKLYCAWPGNYRTDLFIIDDLNSFAKLLILHMRVSAYTLLHDNKLRTK